MFFFFSRRFGLYAKHLNMKMLFVFCILKYCQCNKITEKKPLSNPHSKRPNRVCFDCFRKQTRKALKFLHFPHFGSIQFRLALRFIHTKKNRTNFEKAADIPVWSFNIVSFTLYQYPRLPVCGYLCTVFGVY